VRPSSEALLFPAEWEPHRATWIAWPHNPETWPGCLEEAEEEFRAIVEALLAAEPVSLLVRDEDHASHVAKRLGPLAFHPNLALRILRTVDAWLRDTGPTFVVGSRGLLAIDWKFNAWGGKYPAWEKDDAVAAEVARLAGASVVRSSLVTEGGALETDGEGTLLATTPTLVDPHRNPGLSREEIEAELARLLGVRRVVWLPGGIAGDDTDGHVDDIARFVSPGRVACARETDPRDPNHAPLEACLARLREARDARGRPLDVVEIPMPPPIEAGGARLPATYLNFYLTNGAALVPCFGVSSDETALKRLAGLLPGRRVVGVRCHALVRGFGAVHCLTQQEPAVPA
jgi:agmatine deiminase